MKDANRTSWFPGGHGKNQRLQHQWRLAEGETWGVDQYQSVDLRDLRITDGNARLTIQVDRVIESVFTFPDLASIQMNGTLEFGRSDRGWEVFNAAMLVADVERVDQRVVYVLELSNSLITFASRLGERNRG